MAQGAKFQGIESMVLKSSFARALPEVFGKHKVGKASRVALPAFITYKAFDIQQSDSSWKSQMLEQVRSKAEALRDQAMQELVGDAMIMAVECISSDSQLIRELFI